MKTLCDLQTKLDLSLEEVSTLAKDVLHLEPYTKEEIPEILGITMDEFNDTCLIAHTHTGELSHYKK